MTLIKMKNSSCQILNMHYIANINLERVQTALEIYGQIHFSVQYLLSWTNKIRIWQDTNKETRHH